MWGIKLDSTKTATTIVSMSPTIHLQSTSLTLDGTVPKESADRIILGCDVWCWDELRYASSLFPELHFRGFVSWECLDNSLLFWDIFSSFVIRLLEYCSAVWCSAADSHLTLLEELSEVRVFFSWRCFRVQPYPLTICSSVVHVMSTPMYPLNGALPLPYVPALVTRGTLAARRHSFAPPRCRTFQCCRTSQYCRTFVPPLSISRNVFIDHACLMVWVLRTEPMPSC